MTTTTVTAPDGAAIAVESIGSGPGVVVVNGGAVSAKDYRRFAAKRSSNSSVLCASFFTPAFRFPLRKTSTVT